jgi:hypothetical protein
MLFALPVASSVFRHVCLNTFVLKTVYRHTHNAKDKFKGVVEEELKQIMEIEVRLWHDNDVRTYMQTAKEFLTLDNCDRKIDMPVYHIAMEADRYFDNNLVEQHMRIIFTDFRLIATLSAGNHAPSVIPDAKAAAPYVPTALRRLLAKS